MDIWLQEQLNKVMERADLLQADLDRVDDLHAAECEAYEARIKELEAELSDLLHESMHCTDYDRIEKLLAKARG